MSRVDNSHYYTFILGLLCPDSLVYSLDINIVRHIITIAKVLDYTCTIDRIGTETWAYRNGMRHRGCGLPAVVRTDGTCEWYINGVRHRDGGLPAVIARDVIAWYDSGLLHRDGDLPAIVMSDGRRIWHNRGKRVIFRGYYHHV